MKGIDRSPTPVAGWIGIVTGLVAAATIGLYTWSGLVAGTVGALVLVAGVAVGRESTVSVGAVVLLGGTIGAAVEGAPGPVVLVATVASVLAWDAGRYAIRLGARFGRDAPTARIELVHSAASGLVGVFTAGLGYGIFRSATAGQPLIALVYLLLAAILIATALR